MADRALYAVFASDGLSAAFYDPAIDPPERLPPQAVAIPVNVWLAFLAGGKRWDGSKLVAYAPPALPVDLAAYTAAAHAALRDGGVTIAGMRIKTDGESRGLIDGAYALSQAQPDKPIDFKAATGWVLIDSQTIQTVAIAVGQWVQTCYSAYRKLDEGRMAGTVTTTAQIDAAFAAVALPS